MIDLLIVGVVAAVLLGWLRPAGLRKLAQWRVAAGFLPIGLIAAAGFAAMRGEWIVALALGGVGLALALTVRWPRASPVESTNAAMSLDDARATLGVDAQAGEAEIQAAYLRLMRRVHPDNGGASGLAVQLNRARDRLLGKKP
jgi:hypothetical protein